MIIIQVGQCGNQIGYQLLDSLYASLFDSSESASFPTSNEFFRSSSKGGHVARALAVDTEPKVIKSLLQKTAAGKWKYSHTFYAQSGAGNNWAFGYYRHGPRIFKEIWPRILREKYSEWPTFLVMSSLAGGSGSGLGTYITEQLRIRFPHSCIVNFVIWPYQSGEVALQNYNILLALSRLYRTSSAIIYLRNDTLHEICMERMKLKQVGLSHLNIVAARMLVQILAPSTSSTSDPKVSLRDVVKTLVPTPVCKLLTISFTPMNFDAAQWEMDIPKWDALLRRASQMMIVNSATDQKVSWRGTDSRSHIVSAWFFLRGNLSKDWETQQDVHLFRKLVCDVGSRNSDFWPSRRVSAAPRKTRTLKELAFQLLRKG